MSFMNGLVQKINNQMRTNKIIEAMLFYEIELRCNENLQEHNRTRAVKTEHEIILRALAYNYQKLMKDL